MQNICLKCVVILFYITKFPISYTCCVLIHLICLTKLIFGTIYKILRFSDIVDGQDQIDCGCYGCDHDADCIEKNCIQAKCIPVINLPFLNKFGICGNYYHINNNFKRINYI